MRQPPPGPDFDKCLPAWIAEFHEATGGYHRQTRGGKQTVVVRCYILSRRLEAKEFAEAVRCGWGIEHSLLWQVDVSFGNDACRVLNGLADANLSIVRRSALGLLKHKPSEKIGVKNKRLTAACNTRSMEKVLTRQRLMVQLPCPLSRADGRFLAAVHFGILRGWWSALGYTGLCRIAVRLYRVSWCVAAMFCVFRR